MQAQTAGGGANPERAGGAADPGSAGDFTCWTLGLYPWVCHGDAGRGGRTPGVSSISGSPLPVSETRLPSLEGRCSLRPRRVPRVNHGYFAALSRPRAGTPSRARGLATQAHKRWRTRVALGVT